jgi:hypothetical protein
MTHIMGTITALRAAAVLTTSYVASEVIIDLQKWNAVTLEVLASGTPEAVNATLIVQWSADGVNWGNECDITYGTVAAGEQPETHNIATPVFSVGTAGVCFQQRYNRANRFMRAKIKGASATTTGLVAIQAMPQCI